ncbi:glucose-methanol-choline oxidoreductase [Histoplasma capsulatum var. duboisii H88]|uniref:Glucose-methanol-choline oxidoreductase n=1 Tax=Ajellomyces capsulatus (strain H88) TaxID=544711 RepID=F0U4J2_AJEC8|nr:glucose-methanol-choline oxidoreductase [Histoplasma capsulatum var. duboisii H88]
MAPVFDFIVVGSGPAGSAVASGLARARANPTVLLLEAGDNLEDRNLRVDGQRWLTFQNRNMNWGYTTVPQEYCNNRELDYSRGRGVGGSSAINFGVYSLGARDDYDEWAKIVGDDAFNWDHIHARFKELETFHCEVPAGVNKKYAAPKAADHGTTGPLHVGYAAGWEKDLVPTLDIFEQAGFPLNPDHNSGNPIGMSVLINSAHKASPFRGQQGSRSSDEWHPIPGLERGHPLSRRTGHAEDSDAFRYRPKGAVGKFDIPVVLDAHAVGQGLRDHYFIPLINTVASTNNDRRAFYGNKKVMDEALEQWKRDATGPWSKFSCECGIGWFKIDGLTQTKEFEDLPSEEQEYLQKETVPHYEIFTHFPIHWFVPDFPDSALDYTCLLVFLYNAQARGEVTLQSSDPNEPLRMDPKFLSHPFDRRAAIDSLRDAFRIAKHPAYIKDRLAELAAPKSNSDEDLYWKQNISSSWHMICTAKMGRAGDADAVVDCDYRVMGIDGLRVADMSVIPVLVSRHIQAAAYVTGDTCTEKFIKKYNLA